MPQLSLIEAAAIPIGVTLSVSVDPLEPTSSLTDVRVFGKDRASLRSTGGLWVGTMADYLPSMAQAVVEAYLWGDDAHAVVNAHRRVRQNAVRAQHDWLIRTGQ